MVIFERRMTIEYEAEEWDEVADLDLQPNDKPNPPL